MPKRKAEEAFTKQPLSAFAAAQARKAAQLQAEVQPSTVAEPIPEESPDEDDNDSLVGPDESQPGSRPDWGNVNLVEEQPRVKLSTIDPATITADDTPLDATLSTGEYVTCSGTYTVKVLSGAVSIYGAYLTPASRVHEVYAPFTHALPTIVARFDNTRVVLEPLRSSIRLLERLNPIWARVWPRQSIFSVLLDNNNPAVPQGTVGLQIEKSAQDILNRLSKYEAGQRRPRVLVIGGKGAGKSTFCKLLMNSMLTTPTPKGGINGGCFWLDLDPGQPEFSPPGQVSLIHVKQPLFGPSFTHALPHSALSYDTRTSRTLGANSPRDAIAEYLDFTKDLVGHFDRWKSKGDEPLIINCNGWIGGTGGEAIQELIRATAPTEIVLLESGDPAMAEFTESVHQWSGTINLTRVPPRQQGLRTWTAAELRTLQQMSYQHAKIDEESRSTSWQDKPLSECNQWFASYAGPSPAIDGIASYYEPLPVAELATVLDQATVHIVSVHSDEEVRRDHSPEGIPYLSRPGEQYLRPSSAKAASCLGQGIVTRIDPVRKELHISTPVGRSAISAVQSSRYGRIVLVRPKQAVPDWALLEGVYAPPTIAAEKWDVDEGEEEEEEESTPYVSLRTTGPDDAARAVGQSVWRPRNLPRRV